jgi:Flp pilus assembly protein TadD
MSAAGFQEINLSLADFDRSQLPADRQGLEGDGFRMAVQDYLAGCFPAAGGPAEVIVAADRITLRWSDKTMARTLTEYGVERLQAGDMKRGMSLLRLSLARDAGDVIAAFNLSIALSDEGQVDEALSLLERVVVLAPDYVQAWVALGVALSRKGDMHAAIAPLRNAVDLAPDDGHAQKNLGAALAAIRESAEAHPHLERAVALLPGDAAVWLNFGRNCEDLGKPKLADEAYRKAIDLDHAGKIGGLAEKGLTRIASKGFHSDGSPARPDALCYIGDALDRFQGLPQTDVAKITFEIAMLGSRGLDVNNPGKKYSVASLEGGFSGLHLLCIEYVGFQMIDPSIDLGFDLSTEYQAALALRRK